MRVRQSSILSILSKIFLDSTKLSKRFAELLVKGFNRVENSWEQEIKKSQSGLWSERSFLIPFCLPKYHLACYCIRKQATAILQSDNPSAESKEGCLTTSSFTCADV